MQIFEISSFLEATKISQEIKGISELSITPQIVSRAPFSYLIGLHIWPLSILNFTWCLLSAGREEKILKHIDFVVYGIQLCIDIDIGLDLDQEEMK